MAVTIVCLRNADLAADQQAKVINLALSSPVGCHCLHPEIDQRHCLLLKMMVIESLHMPDIVSLC